jgi:phage I-like protein
MKTALLFPAGSTIFTCAADIGSKAPTEFRIFVKGVNATTKGDFLFDDKAAKQVMATYLKMAGKDRQRRITFDYDHGALQQNPIDPSKAGKSAGNCELELRDGELWAVDVVWTPDAKKGIEDGEWPYISPAFAKDKDNRPTWLINIAITANPATHGLDQLAVAANVLEDAENCVKMALDETRKSMAARLAIVNVADAKPVSSDPRNMAHPALTAPLSWYFEDPTRTGWQGAIEDDESTWIAFIAMNGTGILWTARDSNGMPNGEPLQFFRTDLIREQGAKPPSGIEVPPGASIPEVNDSSQLAVAPPAEAAPVVEAPAAEVIETDFAKLSHEAVISAAPMSTYDYDYGRCNAREMADIFAADATLTAGDAPDHPAATAPLTGRYTDPLTEGSARWLGFIEPINKEWIAFVSMGGLCYLWVARMGAGSSHGAGIGVPLIFKRKWETLSVLDAKASCDDKSVAKLHDVRIALAGAWAFHDRSKDASYAADTAEAVTSLSVEACDLAAGLLARGMKASSVDALGAVPYRGYPVDDSAPWDPDAATHRLRLWSSKDSSGDTETLDFEKYQRGFAYCRSGQEQTLTGYLLPHHDVQHGELVTIKRAVQMAAAAIQGTRVSLDTSTIPPGDLTAIREHIAQHYHQWGAKTPWESQQAKEAVNAMHSKLSDFAKSKTLTAAKLKTKLAKTDPSFTDEELSGLFGEDESKHTAAAVAKMDKALKTLAADPEDNPFAKHSVVTESASIVALGAALGMGLQATELDVVKGVGVVLAGLQSLNILTGKNSIAESLAQVDKWKEGDAAGKTAISELNTAKKSAEKAEALSVIAKFESEGRLTPAQKGKAVDHFDKGGMLALNVYLEDRPVIQGLGQPTITPHTAEAVAALNAAGQLPGVATQKTAIEQHNAQQPAAGEKPAATGAVTDAEVLQLSNLSSMMGLAKGFGKNPGRDNASYLEWCKDQLADPQTLSAYRAEAASFRTTF